MTVRVCNMLSNKGNVVPNQFIIVDGKTKVFQSYGSIIAIKGPYGEVTLDKYYWDYSVTTGKYRNFFLGEKREETLKKIKERTYKMVNLN